MNPRMLTTASMLALLLAATLPAAAFAQAGFDVDDCVAAVAQLDDSVLVDAVDSDRRPSIEDLRARGLDPAEICTIYGADVLPVTLDRQPAGEGEVQAVVTSAAEPRDVLGVSLAVTGANMWLFLAIGIGLVGLGVLAMRRPKRGDVRS